MLRPAWFHRQGSSTKRDEHNFPRSFSSKALGKCLRVCFIIISFSFSCTSWKHSLSLFVLTWMHFGKCHPPPPWLIGTFLFSVFHFLRRFSPATPTPTVKWKTFCSQLSLRRKSASTRTASTTGRFACGRKSSAASGMVSLRARAVYYYAIHGCFGEGFHDQKHFEPK